MRDLVLHLLKMSDEHFTSFADCVLVFVLVPHQSTPGDKLDRNTPGSPCVALQTL